MSTLESILLNLSARLEKLERASAQKIMWGVVAEIDFEAARARVNVGKGVRTPLIPWIAPKAGANAEWTPPEIGEQVLVILPNGAEFSGGVFVTGVYSKRFPAPDARGNVSAKIYSDGARVEYDAETHALKATLPQGSSAELRADAVSATCATAKVSASSSVTLDAPHTEITGDASIGGNLSVSGNVSVAGNAEIKGLLTLAGIVMNTHVHGNGNNGAPTTPPMG